MTMELAVIGARHNHVLTQVHLLVKAGARLDMAHEPDDESFAALARAFPDVRRVDSMDEILASESVRLVTGAAVAAERAAIGIAVLEAGKDYICDKPGVITRAEVEAVQQAMDRTGRRFTIWFHERLSSRAAGRAVDIAKSGRIGDIIGCTVLAPHRLRADGRPDWFWDPTQAGDIIVDLASHHLELFLELTDDAPLTVDWATQDRVARNTVARNTVALTDRAHFSDVATVAVGGPGFMGTINVNWYSPESLGTWGDGRLFIQGTEGYVEARREIDIAGEDGANHVLWVDPEGIHREHHDDSPLEFAAAYLEDLRNDTHRSIPHDRWKRTSILALDASEMTKRPDDATKDDSGV